MIKTYQFYVTYHEVGQASLKFQVGVEFDADEHDSPLRKSLLLREAILKSHNSSEEMLKISEGPISDRDLTVLNLCRLD